MLIRLLSVLVLAFFIAGCNIFDWTSNDNDDVYYEGIRLFNEKKFDEAKEKFAEAMKSDPQRSDYRYYHAKATLFETDINFLTVGREVIAPAKSKTPGYLPLYSHEPDISIEQDRKTKNDIYQIVQIGHDDIHPIFMEETYGEIQKEDILFEYSLFSLTRAILQLRDTNNDGRIDENDFYFSIQVINLTNPEYIIYLGTVDPNSIVEALTNTVSYIGFGADALLEAFGSEEESEIIDSRELERVMDQLQDELQSKIPPATP